MATTSSRVRSAGLDLSLTASGIAKSDGSVKVVGQTDITKLPMPERMQALYNLRLRLLREIGSPEILVMEGLDTSRRYGGVNERAWLWISIAQRYIRWGIPVIDVQSQRGKIWATGSGQATKVAVIQAIQEYYPQFDINKPSGKPDDNRADAVTMMSIGCALLGEPLVALPETHTRVLEKLRQQLDEYPLRLG